MTAVFEFLLTMNMDTSLLYNPLNDGCIVAKHTDAEHNRLISGNCTATNPFWSRLHENHTIVFCARSRPRSYITIPRTELIDWLKQIPIRHPDIKSGSLRAIAHSASFGIRSVQN